MNLTPLRSLFLVVSLGLTQIALAQTDSTVVERPLPDVPTLMHEVEQHQRATERVQKDYIYHEIVSLQDNGKKTENP
jgi:hypothetical protein